MSVTAGQRHDVTQAKDLLAGYAPMRVIADKGYDSAEVLAEVAAMQAEAVIPPKANRRQQRDYDVLLYQERHLVECFINKIKHFRRIFTRFDKLACHYLAFLHFASALIWLR